MQSQVEKNKSVLPHILVVDDDTRIATLVCRYLRDNDFVAVRAESAEEARVMIKNMNFDALVVDIMMPGESGLEFTKYLNEQGKIIPIILLTALGEIENKVEGFESGADDYLAKPFEPKELVMRLKAILKRTQKSQKSGQLKIGRWLFDPQLRILQDDKNKISLTGMEINLIEVLSQSPGEVVSREELARLCNLDETSRTIDVQVTRLRKKIEEDSKSPRYLQTIRGKGYLLRVEQV